MSRRAKKTFAEKLSNKLDKLAKPKDKERTFNKAYQEVYRDYYGNIVVPRPSQEPWSPVSHVSHYSASPAPKRTFHNVIRRGRSAPSHAPSPAHSLANRTWSGWDGGGPQGPPRLGHGNTVTSDHALYAETPVYEEYQNFAINSNVCMCEDYLDGTNRGKKPKKKCKKCGFDRLGFNHHQHSVRRSISEESLTNTGAMYQDQFDNMRRKHKMMMISQKPVFYDEQDEYEDIDFIPRPRLHPRSSSTRKIPTKSKSSRSRSPDQRRSSSPIHKKNARTQSMIVNNRNLLNTKDNKEQRWNRDYLYSIYNVHVFK